LHVSGLDKGLEYGLDIFKRTEVPIDSESSRSGDLRALLSFTRRVRSKADIRRELLRAASINNLSDHVDMVDRALAELRDWIKTKGYAEIRREAGV
jgi:hypothetical protein